MTKNYGTPPVSGYLEPSGRAWETVVFEAGKPVLDRELNLSQDVDGGAAQEALRRAMPSGWLDAGFLSTSNPVDAIYQHLNTSNTLEIPNGLRAHVNGWLIQLQHSYVTGSNRLNLGAGPGGAGSQRTDLVILEVWRRLVKPTGGSADGSTSATNRIWQQGNVTTDPAGDLVLNYANDLLDVNVGSETTSRVQIQYRLRVISGVDLFSFPYGMDDPNVFANSTPTTPATPNGVVTAFTYVNQSANGDPGLWVAGDGLPTNTLDTVDGYMYAIPLMGVFRRNTVAFARLTNQNGGVAFPGPSDRPDGYFSNIIEASDLVDLRSGVSPTGWSLSEVLEKNTNLILDNSKRTEIVNTAPDGGGNSGTTVLRANEIGGSSTAAGPLIGQFDAVRRRFSARSTYETVTVAIPPPGGAWNNGEVVTVDPTALPVYPYAAFNWSSFAPTDVRFLDVVDMHWAGTSAAGQEYEDAEPSVVSLTGLGAIPIVSVSITFGTVPAGLTDETLFVTLLVGYPTGVGLSHTPTEDYGNASFALNTAPLSAAAPVSFSAFSTRDIDAPHREAQIEYTTVNLAYAFRSGAAPTNTYRLPERASSIVSVTSTPVQGGAATLDASGRIVTLVTTPTADTAITITYVAVRPVPAFSAPQMVVYYRAAAPQMAPIAFLGTTLTVVPKLTSEKMWTLTVGAGSQDDGYPFPYAYVQTGGVFPSLVGVYSGESDLAGKAAISVADFDSETGMVRLPVYVPMVANPEQLTFTRGLGDIDVEDRTYFTSVPGSAYVPNAYAQDLSNPDRHKNIFPILAELAEDGLLGFKGQLVVVLLIRYAVFDETNGVYFDADLNANTTSASVYRVKGLLLNKRVS